MLINVDKTVQVLMYRLADNYIEGMIAVGIVIEAIYLIFSIRLLFTTRDAKMDVYSLVFIPFFNILIWVRKCMKMRSMRTKELIRSYDDLF